MLVRINVTFLFLLLAATVKSYPLPGKNLLVWNFPLPRTHTGVVLGNGVQGIMIWGHDNQLNITVSRAGFWDHQGRKHYTINTNYEVVKNLLFKKDAKGLDEAFGIPATGEDKNLRSKQIGGGRLEVKFPEGFTLQKAILNLEAGTIVITLLDDKKKLKTLTVKQSVSDEIAWIEFANGLEKKIKLNLIPTWDYVGDKLKKIGIDAPQHWTANTSSNNSHGFIQTLPEDEDLTLGYAISGNQLRIATLLGDNRKELLCKNLEKFNSQSADLKRSTWWSDYWKAVPELVLPDTMLQEMAMLGLYKQACATPPHGLPCGLQGPFMEEYQLPPWSNDYHFNINAQMIYWPALASNRVEHFAPLWKMVEDALPLLSRYGEQFFQRKGAMLFPHAVDDGGYLMSGFWAGTMDHATSAWVAQLAWLSYRYSLDDSILKKVAWPLMNGSFEGYCAMLEKEVNADGSYHYVLPASVSPEWRGKRLDAWGKNASFQLAAIQMITSLLPRIAKILNQPVNPKWADVKEHTPPYTIMKQPETLEYPERKVERIVLWENEDLMESHRHHSHMASVYPFKTINPLDPKVGKLAKNTLNHWLLTGNGAWLEWTLPWSASLLLQYGYVDAAIANLHYLYRYGYNEGRATVMDFAVKGLSYNSGNDIDKLPIGTKHNEVMQLDGTFGALNSILEILVKNENDTIYVMPFTPRGWENFSFKNVLAEGAFLISADINNGNVQNVKIVSKKGGEIKLKHNLGERYWYQGKEYSGPFFMRNCYAGEVIELRKN